MVFGYRNVTLKVRGYEHDKETGGREDKLKQ